MSRKVGYTTVFKEAFIADVRQRTALWNKNDSKYGDRLFCQVLWDEVASERGMSRDAAKKLWKSLVDQFRKKFLHLGKKGLDESKYIEKNDSQKGKWSLFSEMFFVSNRIARGQNTAHLSTSDESCPDPESTETEDRLNTACVPSDSLIDEQSMEAEHNSSEKASPVKRRIKRVLEANRCSATEKRVKASNGEQSVLNHLSTLSKAIGEVSTNLSTVSSGPKSSAFTNLVLEQMESVPSHLRIRCMIGILQVIESFVPVPSTVVVEYMPNAEISRTDR